jgi:hypothetical protein
VCIGRPKPRVSIPELVPAASPDRLQQLLVAEAQKVGQPSAIVALVLEQHAQRRQ